MQPLVSILIPAYNAEKYLADTLRSALAQSWPAKEIIVIDDGSKDNTLAVARAFESANVKVIAQENRGQSATENHALEASQGELLEFLDADDLLSPDKIATQVRRLCEEGFDCMAACRWGRFYDDPAGIQIKPEPFWKDLPPVDWLTHCWERHSMMHGAAWLIPRRIVDRAGFWNESLSLINDFDFFTRVNLECRQILFCWEPCTYYRSGLPTSLSGSKSAAAWDSAIRSLDLGTSRLLAAEDSSRTRRACIRQYQEFIFAAYPDCPELRARARRRVQELGGERFAPQGGPVFRAVSNVVGWRIAKRMQRLKQRWSYVGS
ncbi:MAG: glycosyltransferase family 2 protein [Gemmataceae bacterium]